MQRLKNKASRFFKSNPSEDEQAAASVDERFNAGIEARGLRKNPSRFFQRAAAVEKPLPVLPSSLGIQEGVSPGPDVPKKDEGNDKPRPGFSKLRKKGSRFFRAEKPGEALLPPPPPPPQIPVEPVAPRSSRSSSTPSHSTKSSRSSHRSSKDRRLLQISRPYVLPSSASASIPPLPTTVAFTKRPGPPPPRPLRAGSLDEGIRTFMREGTTRMVLPGKDRSSNSTASSSKPHPHSLSSSFEARLGIPSGNGAPRGSSLNYSLATQFPLQAGQPLPVRDSSGSIKHSRFSDYVRAEHGGYASGSVEESDHDLGPIEQPDRNNVGGWTLEKRVSRGPNGCPGMLFRDRSGAFHFVADI